MEEQIIDSENFRNNEEGYGFREICMRQFQTVVRNSSQEMHGGINIFSHVKNMEPELIRYIADTRKKYTRSLDCLHDILLPKFDNEMEKKSKEIYKKIEKLEDNLENKKFWEENLNFYRELFQALCLLLERLSWLGSSSFEE